MDLQTKLEQLFQQNNDTIKKVKSLDELNQIRVQLLGKKGPITGVLPVTTINGEIIKIHDYPTLGEMEEKIQK